MKALEPNERMAITLNVSEGLSHSEITQITGIPLGTIKSYISRAKKKLSELVSDREQVA
jgi:RNA polymerase sigma-70 factor (ECF subfamily)